MAVSFHSHAVLIFCTCCHGLHNTSSFQNVAASFQHEHVKVNIVTVLLLHVISILSSPKDGKFMTFDHFLFFLSKK